MSKTAEVLPCQWLKSVRNARCLAKSILQWCSRCLNYCSISNWFLWTRSTDNRWACHSIYNATIRYDSIRFDSMWFHSIDIVIIVINLKSMRRYFCWSRVYGWMCTSISVFVLCFYDACQCKQGISKQYYMECYLWSDSKYVLPTHTLCLIRCANIMAKWSETAKGALQQQQHQQHLPKVEWDRRTDESK